MTPTGAPDGQRTRWRRVATCLIALILTLLATQGLITVIARSELAREVRKARAHGMPDSFEGLALAGVPPEENAAVLYAQAFESLQAPGIEEHQAVMALSLGWSPEKIAAEDALSAARRYLETHRAALVLLREGSRRPRCRFEIDWEAAGKTTWPHLAHVRAAAKALRVDAAVALLEERPHDAVIDMETILRLAEGLLDEPWLISCLVRKSIRGVARDLTRPALQSPGLSEADLASLDRLASMPDSPDSWKRGIDGECSLLVYRVEAFRAGLESVADLRLPGATTLSQGERRRWNCLGWTGTRDAALCLQTMTELRGLVGIEYQVAHKRFAEFRKLVDEAPSYCWMSRGNAIAAEGVLRSMAEEQAEHRVGRLAVGLVKYHRMRGVFPVALQDLVPDFVPEVWTDPLTGGSFLYEVRDRGVRISIGADAQLLGLDWILGDTTEFGEK